MRKFVIVYILITVVLGIVGYVFITSGWPLVGIICLIFAFANIVNVVDIAELNKEDEKPTYAQPRRRRAEFSKTVKEQETVEEKLKENV